MPFSEAGCSFSNTAVDYSFPDWDDFRDDFQDAFERVLFSRFSESVICGPCF